MFDKTNTGEIVFNDFAALWAFVNAWQAAFVRFDTDRSGNISTGELESCIRSLGYNLSPHFFTLVVPKFSKPGAVCCARCVHCHCSNCLNCVVTFAVIK